MPGISPTTVAYLKTLRAATAQVTGSIDAYLAGLADGIEARSEYVYLGELLTRGAQANADSMRNRRQAILDWEAANPAVPARIRALAVFSPVVTGDQPDGTRRLDAYSTWLGRMPSVVVDNADETKGWTQVISTAGFAAKFWTNRETPLLLRIPLLPGECWGKFGEGNAGAYDAHYLAIARSLVPILDRGLLKAVGLGWETNGNWYPWSAFQDPEGYVALYRRVVALFRTIDPRFRFDWNCAIGTQAIAPKLIFPGKDVVDSFGADVYDEGSTNAATRWTAIKAGAYGLNTWDAWSAETGIPLTVPEWGVSNRANRGGGDNPPFIDNMAAWFDSLGDRLLLHAYFERAHPAANHLLSRGAVLLSDGVTPEPTRFPRTAAKFRQVFGNRR